MGKKSRRVRPPRAAYVPRPFAGLAAECDLVALREFVPSATASVVVRGHEDRDVVLCTLLPGAVPADVTDDGTVRLGLQVQHAFRDPSRDLAAALLLALAADPGERVALATDPGDGERLQDLLADDGLEVTVHSDFGFWGLPEGSVSEQADAMATPTARLSTVEAAYWAQADRGPGGRAYVRWVMGHDEDLLVDALARLHVAGTDGLTDGARLVGMFRAHGLVVPVWEVEAGGGAAEAAHLLDAPASAFGVLLEQTMADPTPLDAAVRSARAGLTNRQVTLR